MKPLTRMGVQVGLHQGDAVTKINHQHEQQMSKPQLSLSYPPRSHGNVKDLDNSSGLSTEIQ